MNITQDQYITLVAAALQSICISSSGGITYNKLQGYMQTAFEAVSSRLISDGHTLPEGVHVPSEPHVDS